ncbi:unnamed protein product [Rotaria socialis]|uniref:Uncharacterized protein n=1 Tax=Rotaria socialis TaxID=392032 RepID=A0A817UUE9_9BILA|nr:unnamed protein product [Rotaria socialis]
MLRSATVLLSSSLSPSSTNNQRPLTTSDNVLQQIASPNLIPIIVPSDTIQSNSTSITVFSISKSTEDETCDINIIEQPSSSLTTKRQLNQAGLQIPCQNSTILTTATQAEHSGHRIPVSGVSLVFLKRCVKFYLLFLIQVEVYSTQESPESLVNYSLTLL